MTVPVEDMLKHEQRLLAVDGLAVQFPDERSDGGVVRAVDGISFHIDRGETVALVGESGSGKSVSALSLLRLAELGGGRLAAGEMAFRRKGGECIDLVRASPRALRDLRGNDISMIFQEPMTSLNPVMTVGDQIAEAIRLHRGKSSRDARALAAETLARVRMPDPGGQLTRYPHQLSGGMRQRAMIAMALACQPSLLIADEPTTALDVTIQAQILDLVKLLQAELGMAVLFITHDMGVVAEVADRVLVMLRGKVVETGTVHEVFASPRHAYTRALLDAVPRLGSMTGSDRPMRFANVDVTRAEGDDIDVAGAPAPREMRATRLPNGDAAPLLAVEHLTTRFDITGGLLGTLRARVHAVEDVSFELRPGETLALVGESGCGKSTTGRSILRLVDPQSGRILFRGEDVSKLGRADLGRLRRDAQMIFQDPFASLNPRKTVGWLIAEPLAIHGIARGAQAEARVVDLLDRVGLEANHRHRYPHEFSGGQRQRICIARALALDPALIVADEAVSALDVSIQAQVVNLLLDLQDEFGLAYLFISHDLAVVERVAHRVAVMYLGEIVELGPRAAVFEDPRHPYTRKLLRAVPVADPAQRRERALEVDELPSPLRGLDYAPPRREMHEVAPGHLVQVSD